MNLLFDFTFYAEPVSRQEPQTNYIPGRGNIGGWRDMHKALRIVKSQWDRGTFLFNLAKAAQVIERVSDVLRNTADEPAKGFINHYIKADQKEYILSLKHEMKLCWGGKPPLDEPLRLGAKFFRTPPKSLPKTVEKHPDTKPDLSNYIKLVEDAMSDIVIKNDSRIARYTSDTGKYFALDGKPRTELKIYSMKVPSPEELKLLF